MAWFYTHALIQTYSEYTDDPKEPRARGTEGKYRARESPFLKPHALSSLGGPVLAKAGRPGVKASNPPVQCPYWL